MDKQRIRSLYNTIRLLKDTENNIDVTIKLSGNEMLIEGHNIMMKYTCKTIIPIENEIISDKQLTITVDSLLSVLGKLREFDRLIIKADYGNRLTLIGSMDNEDIRLCANIPIIKIGEQVNEPILDNVSVDSTPKNDNEIWI